jgi:phage tail protein X
LFIARFRHVQRIAEKSSGANHGLSEEGQLPYHAIRKLTRF